MGDAVAAVKRLAKTSLEELDVKKLSSFYTDDILFQPRQFNCGSIPKTSGGPATVHQLTPSDIGIVAAAGDSITAGQGIGALTVIETAVQQRGRSWSIGGESSIEDGFITLPNILKKYNPNLRGYSTGSGEWDDASAGLNLAVPNSVAALLPVQMDRMIAELKENYTDAWDTEWKLLTIMIGRNDLCNYCEDSQLHSVDNYVRYVQDALDIAHKEIPKMLVQVVAQFDISSLRFMATDMTCDFIQKLLCPCALFEDFRQPLRNVQIQFYERVKEIVDGGRYDTRDDFTVVMQPFMVYNDPLTNPGTDEVDTGFFAVDCLHPSWRAHRVMAFNLWQSMFIPTGKKTTKIPSNFYEFEHDYFCPAMSDPYIKTNKNSDGEFPPPQPTPSRATTSSVGLTTYEVGIVTLILSFYSIFPLQ